jgi:ABC-type branched-subunit amino acid transport system permease subunit
VPATLVRTEKRRAPAAPLVGAAAIAALTLFAILFLWVESETAVTGLLLAAVATAVAGARLGWLAQVQAALGRHDMLLNGGAVVAVLAIAAFFYRDHFALLMVATVLLYVLACLGLTIQFGYAGILNFSGAAFFGVGAYTSAVLTAHTPVPHLLVLLAGGAMAALIGSILIYPVLRTRGHYAAVVTIAFALLFKTFLEVNDVLGGPQGLAVANMNLFGWDFGRGVELGPLEASFILNYVLLALLLVAIGMLLVKRLERSWIGLNMDAIRLDETASACFGIDLARWKVTAFTLGNFLAGVAGGLHGMMLAFIAPNNFTFADGLIMVSIVLLGGIGNPWGVVVAAVIVIILPEKLQIIQEYRFLLFAATVILILRFRPGGLLPRGLRQYFPGRQP